MPNIIFLFLLLTGFSATHALAGGFPASPFYPPFQTELALKEEKLTPADLQEIDAGKTLIRSRPLPKGKKGAYVMAAAAVRGTVEQVFDVIMDCKGQPKYIPHLVACGNTYAAAPSEPAIVTFDQTEKLKFGFAFVTKEIGYTVHTYAMRPFVKAWTFKEGDVQDTEGYWRVIPYKNGQQILMYSVFTNPGTIVPGWVQEILIKQDLPKTVEAFKNRVERGAAPN